MGKAVFLSYNSKCNKNSSRKLYVVQMWPIGYSHKASLVLFPIIPLYLLSSITLLVSPLLLYKNRMAFLMSSR